MAVVQKIAGYWRLVVERRVVSTHPTKASAIAALKDYNRERQQRQAK